MSCVSCPHCTFSATFLLPVFLPLNFANFIFYSGGILPRCLRPPFMHPSNQPRPTSPPTRPSVMTLKHTNSSHVLCRLYPTLALTSEGDDKLIRFQVFDIKFSESMYNPAPQAPNICDLPPSPSTLPRTWWELQDCIKGCSEKHLILNIVCAPRATLR